tara:strand:+ start:1805 stop:2419 length:615 start_codon:yes stop_codon:yes gene_type:complete
MAFPTTNSQQELPAVNQILQSCGQAPVTTLDQTNPDVAIAYQTLLEVSREVQAEGWTFNKENHYKMVRNTDNEILIPNNILQIDATDNAENVELDVIRRSGKLYDKAHHKYTFDKDIEVDIVWLFDWVDLPKPIADFITARAATITSSRIVGDNNLYQILQQKEAFTRAMAMEYECNQGDYTFFGHSGNTNQYISYQPYKALIR